MKNLNIENIQIETYVYNIMHHFMNRKDIFEPLSLTLGPYQQKPFLRAVKNVLFEKIRVDIPNKNKYIWVFKHYNDCPKQANYVSWISTKIIAEDMKIRNIIRNKNRWGRLYPSRTPIKSILVYSSKTKKLEDFKIKCPNSLGDYKKDFSKRDELLHNIYEYEAQTFKAGYEKGYAQGLKDSMKTTKKLVSIFDSIEQDFKNFKDILFKI